MHIVFIMKLYYLVCNHETTKLIEINDIGMSHQDGHPIDYLKEEVWQKWISPYTRK